MGGGGQGVFYFRFSIFVLAPGFRPPGEKNKERRRKNEEGKEAADMVCGSGEFSIFVFLFSFLPLVSVPQGEREKKEDRRRKKGKRLLA
jgi:hypothetical protein